MTGAVVFVGLATLDIVYGVGSYPPPDSKNTAEQQFLGAGGPAANAAITCAHLSARPVTLVTALGRHVLAGLVADDLAAHGVSVADATPQASAQPPVSSIVTAADSETRTVFSLDGARIHAEFNPGLAALVQGAAAVLVDGHHPDLAAGMAQAARSAGVPVVVDAGRWKPVFADLLPLTDVLICSEAFAPPGIAHTPESVFEFVRAAGVGSAAITQGPWPILLSSGEEIIPRQIRAADTLGAGDVLHGAFCHYLTSGYGFREALQNASAVATTSCEYFGPREWMSRSDIQSLATSTSTTSRASASTPDSSTLPR
jgi:sugar/nucleoside kinase (ribokinase family)